MKKFLLILAALAALAFTACTTAIPSHGGGGQRPIGVDYPAQYGQIDQDNLPAGIPHGQTAIPATASLLPTADEVEVWKHYPVVSQQVDQWNLPAGAPRYATAVPPRT